MKANLLAFHERDEIAAHFNEAVDVLLIEIVGAGTVTVDDVEHYVTAGDALVIPKGTRNGPVGTEAARLIAASVPNFRILECANQLHESGLAAIQTVQLPITARWCDPQTRPGLGVDLDEVALRRFAVNPASYYPGTYEAAVTPGNV